MKCDWCGEVIKGPTRIDLLYHGKGYAFCDEDCCKEFLYEYSGAGEVEDEDYCKEFLYEYSGAVEVENEDYK